MGPFTNNPRGILSISRTMKFAYYDINDNVKYLNESRRNAVTPTNMPCTSYRRRVIRNISPSRAASEIHTISNSKRRRSETKTRSVTFANDTFKSSASSASVHRRKNRTLRSSKRRTSSQRSRSVSSSRSQRSSRSRSKRKERVKKTRSTMSDGSEKSKSRSNRGLVKRRRSRRQALTGVKTKARKPRRRDSKGRFV